MRAGDGKSVVNGSVQVRGWVARCLKHGLDECRASMFIHSFCVPFYSSCSASRSDLFTQFTPYSQRESKFHLVHRTISDIHHRMGIHDAW
jgi:hypothetical protein